MGQKKRLEDSHKLVKCYECGGSGQVDSGGQTPWGSWIMVTCPYCNGMGKLLIDSLGRIVEPRR